MSGSAGAVPGNGLLSNLTSTSMSYIGTVEHTPADQRVDNKWLHYDEENDEADEESAKSGLPLLLIGFVCLMACVAGVTVVGIHDAVMYSGCALGINMCNEFRGKEDKGYFLVKALDMVPEWIIYTLMSTLGCTIVATLLSKLPQFLSAQLRGGGTVQALTAAAAGQTIPLPAAILRIFVSCVYLGFGGSLGMEGPCIQVCTSLATLAGWYLGIRSVQTQSLLASLGFSCGFAASFNAPLSGILFALEELQHVTSHLSQSMICIILLGSALSAAVVRALHGNIHLFAVTWDAEMFNEVEGYSLNKVFGMHMWMLIAIPIGFFSSLVTWGLVTTVRVLHEKLIEAYGNGWASWRSAFIMHGFLTALMGGFVFWVTGLRGIWGVGVESVQEALRDDDMNTLQYLVFACAKLTALALGVSVRGPGDTLEPVLISGAFFGGMFGKIIHWAGAGVEGAAIGAIKKPCVIFGMTGMFASCFRFPLTPIVIVMELTGSDEYALVLPTILTCFTANIISNRLCLPLLHEMMRQDGVDLHALAMQTRKEIDEAMIGDDESDEASHAPIDGSLSPRVVTRSDRRTVTNSSHSHMEWIGRNLDHSLCLQGYSKPKRTVSRDAFALHHNGFERQTSSHSAMSDRSADVFGTGVRKRANSKGTQGSHGTRSDRVRSCRLSRPSDNKANVIDASALTNDQIMAELSKRLDPQWDLRPKAGSEEGCKEPVLTEEERFESLLNDEIHKSCGKFILEEDDDDE